VAGLSAVALAIVCSQPGFRRAGIAHPAREIHPAGRFTEEQLAAMLAEPRLQLIPLDGLAENASGEGVAGAAPGGPVPLPRTDGAGAPPVPANAVAGDDTLPSAAPGGGDAAAGAAPVSDTLPGGATPDSAGASPVDAAKAHDAAEASGAAAPPPAGGEAPGGVAPAPVAAPATRRAKRG
jgi:hypothetical protein